MGRRIYDDKNVFVWKYMFGLQMSEMVRYAKQYQIGSYDFITTYEDECESLSGVWRIEPKRDLVKMEKLLTELCGGKSYTDIEKNFDNIVKKYEEKHELISHEELCDMPFIFMTKSFIDRIKERSKDRIISFHDEF